MRETLILLPGWGLNGAVLQPLAEALGSNMQVQVPALPRLSSAAEADWLDELDTRLPHDCWLAGWSLGGMLASQCGLPLMPTGWSGRNNFDETQAPLRGATCLGDVLRKAGYETAFIGGADPAFAGKQYFLHDHGFNQVYGRDDIHTQMNGYQWPEGWWGAEDHTMLAFSTQVLDDLERSHQPFFLSLLTLDTHGPNGLPSRHGPPPAPDHRLRDIFDKNRVVICALGDRLFIRPLQDTV